MIADKLRIPAANVVEIPATGIGDLSDGYHTFNGLYYQRMVLFAALVNAYNDRAWKSWKHEDGKPCFDGGWFIVGIDTPLGSYTYHFEDKYWNWFECEELAVAKYWDGHTEEDVIRLLSLDVRLVVQKDDLLSALREYFSIGDSYTYELTRVKSAFEIGTMSFDDFEEWGEEKIFDLCEYLMCKIFCPDHGAEMHEGGASSGGEYADNPTLAPT